jgi:Thioesterase superfamily
VSDDEYPVCEISNRARHVCVLDCTWLQRRTGYYVNFDCDHAGKSRRSLFCLIQSLIVVIRAVLAMEVLVNGLRASRKPSIRMSISTLPFSRQFPPSPPSYRLYSIALRVRDQSNSKHPFKHSTTSSQQLRFLDIRRNFHQSPRICAEDPQNFKPPHYPEAEWQKVNDKFEQDLLRRSWFFRPLWRLLAHPKNHSAIFTFQFLMIGTVISGWIFIWFFMGQASKPIPRDGTGRPLNDEEIEETETIENYLHSHPVVQAIRSQKHLIESRPHWAIPDRDIPHNLTGGTLRGLGRMSVAPIAFSDGEGSEFYAVLHVGKDLCGPRGTVHSGFLATIVDESLARCCFPALPNRIGVTANLNIDYRNSLPVDSYVLVKVYCFLIV